MANLTCKILRIVHAIVTTNMFGEFMLRVGHHTTNGTGVPAIITIVCGRRFGTGRVQIVVGIRIVFGRHIIACRRAIGFVEMIVVVFVRQTEPMIVIAIQTIFEVTQIAAINDILAIVVALFAIRIYVV